MEKVTRVRHVPEEDSRVQKERMKRFDQSKGTAGIFGEVGANLYDVINDRIQYLKEQNTRSREYLQGIDPSDWQHQAVSEEIARRAQAVEELEKDKGKNLIADFVYLANDLSVFFRNPLRDPEKTAYVRSRLKELFLFPEIKEKIEQLFGEDLEGLTPSLLKENVESGALETELLYSIAKKNVEIVKKESEKFRELCDSYRDEFKKSVVHAVEEGKLPDDALKNLSRVDTVKFGYRDTMYMISYSAEGGAGNHGDITASGMNITRPERLRHTIFHELMHEISGKTLQLEVTLDEKWEDLNVVSQSKSGLVFKGGERHGMWINEAMTEALAIQLSGYKNGNESDYKGSPFYADERREVDDLLMRAGKSSDELWVKMLQAYFENIRNDQPVSEKAKSFAELVEMVNLIKGKHAWNRIQNSFFLHRQIVGGLKVPLTASKEVALQFAASEKVYQIVLGYGKNPLARAAELFYYIPASEDMIEKDLGEMRQAVKRYRGFAFSQMASMSV